jgi:large subunit ribosomal protein L30
MATTTTDTEVASQIKRITVKWVKSAIGYDVRQKRTLKALGFSKLGQEVQHDDTPQIRGMLNVVKHLVEVR